MVPVPVESSVAPEPTTIAALILVLLVKAENAVAALPAHGPHVGAAPTDPVPVSVRQSVDADVLASVTPVAPDPVW